MPEEIRKKSVDVIEKLARKSTMWVGSVNSILIHTALFIFAFTLYFFGANLNKILLVVTTLVSLEAIYLAIFIQMTVNRQSQRLRRVSRDIDEIQEDIDEIQEDVDEIQEDVEEIQEGVEDIQEEEEKSHQNKSENTTLTHIQILLSELARDIKELKDKQK